MILATSDDYDYPHIDWHCKECGEVYCYAGYPPETRCLSGHGAGWRPEDDQLDAYIEFLEGLTTGDGVVICGDGPAALMGPVKTAGRYNTQTEGPYNYIITESIESPPRKVRWDPEEPSIEWCKADAEYESWRDVWHVESVEIETTSPQEAEA